MTIYKTSVWSKFTTFVKCHPIISNLALIIITAVILVWLIGVVFLNWWTNHNDNAVVPQVKGLKADIAVDALSRSGFVVELDSIYDITAVPGTVIDQSPHENSVVKPGRTIYLRYVCFAPKLVTVPEYYNMSSRNAVAAFENVGLNNLTIKEVPSDISGLVLGARYNGLILTPGKKIPLGASITIEVGAGAEDNIDEYSSGSEELILPEDADEEFIENLNLDF